MSRVPVFPVLIALFPMLSLLANNIEEISQQVAIRSLTIITASAVIALILLWLAVRQWARAGIIVSVVAILFFSYGHAYDWLEPVHLAGIQLGRHRYLLPLWVTLIVLSTWVVLRLKRPHEFVSRLNLLAGILVAIPLIQIHYFQVQRAEAFSVSGSAPSELGLSPAENEPLRDIYYVILDAYTRDDTLLSYYQYDNSEFLRQLENRGFYVARCGQSNYARTSLSLASSLNLDYLTSIHPGQIENGLDQLIKDNLVRRELENFGYTTVAFETTYPKTERSDAEIFLTGDTFEVLSADSAPGLNAFEALLFKSSLGLAIMDANTRFGGDIYQAVETSPKRDRYELIQFTLDKLEDVPAFRGPKFVFVHVLAPHEPYIFSRDGSFVPDQEEPVPGYSDQVHYINQRILHFIDIAHQEGSPEPIIILQGDHGGVETWADGRRMNILSAFLFPGGADTSLYPSITPVNTFRLVFDNYFGANMGTPPDVSYHSTYKDNFDFEIIVNSRQGCP